MMTPSDIRLPERAILLHIGPPKTGSTSLQSAAAAQRSRLLDHGVRYPGATQTHRRAVAGFMARPMGWAGSSNREDPDSSAHSMVAWDGLMHEIDADRTRRILLGHEYIAGADEPMARKFVDALGDRTHVVITLRNYGSMLPSIWQQFSKIGATGSFDQWLKRALEYPRSAEMVQRLHLRHDHGGLVRRWAQVVGPDNVTVIALNPADHGFVFRAFEDLLGLPSGLFTDDGPPPSSNRSLTVPEIAMIRRFNRVVRDQQVDWSDYQRLATFGAALRLVQTYRPKDDDERLALPEWALPRVLEEQRRYVQEIRESGVRTIGDLSMLEAAPRTHSAPPEVDRVPVEAAAQAMAGMFSAATGRGWNFWDPATLQSRHALSSVPASNLVAELRTRVLRRTLQTAARLGGRRLAERIPRLSEREAT